MEVISLHVGHAGVAAAGPLWQLYCLEHGLNPDGSVSNMKGQHELGFKSFFRDSITKASPWAMLIDLDRASIDETLVGNGKLLFHRGNTVNGEEDGGSNYAKARYSMDSKAVVALTMSKLRLMAEACSSLQGFIIQHALGGGTSSGLTCNLLEKIYYAYPKKPTLQFAIYPSAKLSLSVVEPYNTILGTAATKPGDKCCCLATNAAMYRILERNHVSSSPDFKDLNVLWDYAISTATANMRLGGELNSKLQDILTNLVPYPRMRFPFLSYSPVSLRDGSPTVNEVVRTCFNPSSQLFNCDVKNGYYMAASLMLRGQTSPQQVSETLVSIRAPNNVKFAPWCPNGFKISLCPKPSSEIPGSVLSPGNISACAMNASNAVSQSWADELNNYKVLLRKKAFIHWYLSEGMEESEFHEAGEEISKIITHYQDIAS